MKREQHQAAWDAHQAAKERAKATRQELSDLFPIANHGDGNNGAYVRQEFGSPENLFTVEFHGLTEQQVRDLARKVSEQ